MNQDKIRDLMQNGKQEKAFVKLYRLYPKVEKYICINSGSKDEASDIFQEALIILYKKINGENWNDQIQLDGFLINSCKLLWKNELRKKKVRKKSSDDQLTDLPYEDEIQAQIEKENKLVKIDQIINKIGETCKKMLEMFYFKRISMEKIAKTFGYKSIQSAKTKKFKCMEKARKLALESEQNITL